MLRQSGALAPVTLEELPRPSAPPFEALGDLQVLLPELSAAVLAPYDDVPADAPGPWALSFHRRRSTRWRRALLAAAPEDRAARTWLAVLGEAGAVSSALKRGPRQARARRGRQVRGPTPPAIPEHELVPLARQVALEVAGQTDAMSGRAVDVWAVERRLAALDQATREGDSVGAIEACRSLGTSAPPTAADWRAITEELLERGVPDEVLAEVSARWAPTCGSVSAELVVRLLPFPLCRRVFVARLASLEPDWLVGWYCRLVAAAAALGNVELEPFLDEWLRAWLLRAQADLGDEALYAFDGLKERLLSLAWGDVSTAVGVFQWVPEAAVAARMIPELVSRFGPSALRAALATQSQEGPDVADRHRWLLAAIDGPS